MTNYRRVWIPGGTYFFTVALAERSKTTLIDHVSRLRSVMRTVRLRHPFLIDAIVILPDHLHAIWTLPKGDSGFAKRWSLIKANFSRGLQLDERRSASRVTKRERGVWQRRYWEHVIRDEHDLRRHIDYVHYNPVKHGYVTRAADWGHSSIHRFIRAGWCTPDWGANADVVAMEVE